MDPLEECCGRPHLEMGSLSRTPVAAISGKSRSCDQCGRAVECPITLPQPGHEAGHFCSARCVFSAVAAGHESLRMVLQRQRSALLQALEQERGSRIITLIHRVEMGEHTNQFITIEDSEQILYEIRSVPEETPIDFILHCPGGIVLAAEQITLALKEHGGKVTAIVPHYAMSGATLCCLAADEILMDPHSVLGPLDPQIGNFPAPSLVKLLTMKPVEAIGDEMLVLADIAIKALRQTQNFVVYVLRDRMGQEKASKLAEFLTGGYLTHDSPLVPEQLQRLGLPVRVGIPPEVYALLRLHKLSNPHSTSPSRSPESPPPT